MKCSQCNQELNFPEEVLKKFTSCPFCGAAFSIRENKEQTFSPIETELKRIVDEFGGLEIFSEENFAHLNKALMDIDDKFADERDQILIANIKHIPQKLYSAQNMTPKEQQQIVDSCCEELKKIGKTIELSKTISYLANMVNLDVLLKDKKRDLKKLSQMSYQFSHFSDVSEYKTCVIGDKEWFAEDLNEDYGYSQYARNEPNCSFRFPCDDKHKPLLYDWYAAAYNAPKGWRLPTIKDFKDTAEYIKSLNYDVGTALKSKEQWDGTANQGLDIFGFCAFPKSNNNNISEISFWTSTPSNDEKYPYCIAKISANSNDLQLSSRATTDYQCAVRYVRDYNEKEWIELKGNHINLYEWVDELSEMYKDDSVTTDDQKRLTFATIAIKLLKEKLDLSDDFVEKISTELIEQITHLNEDSLENNASSPNIQQEKPKAIPRYDNPAGRLAELLEGLGMTEFRL